MRMTVEDTSAFKRSWDLHAGDSEPIVRHFRSTQKVMHLPGFGFPEMPMDGPIREGLDPVADWGPKLVAVTSEA